MTVHPRPHHGHIEPRTVPGEGEEAWLAFDLLVGADAEYHQAVPPISVDRANDVRWLTACKVARHLGLCMPDRTPAIVEAFLEQHVGSYLRRRALRKLSS